MLDKPLYWLATAVVLLHLLLLPWASLALADVAPAGAAVPATDEKWPHGYVAACLAVKNQKRDLPEWLAYHQSIGVSKVRRPVMF